MNTTNTPGIHPIHGVGWVPPTHCAGCGKPLPPTWTEIYHFTGVNNTVLVSGACCGLGCTATALCKWLSEKMGVPL